MLGFTDLYDADVIAAVTFFRSMFRHADPLSYLSIRAYDDREDGKPALFIEAIPVGHPLVPDILAERMRQASNHPRPHVFCPPVATFTSAQGAKTEDLANGLAASVECDEEPDKALLLLTKILGEPTIVVASGGEWLNPATGELEPKLHLHWRLKQPTRTKAEHAYLRQAREMAARLVGADATTISIVHPMRWPGSWHRKGQPKLARIVSSTETELDLSDALDRLRDASGQAQQAGGGAQAGGSFWRAFRLLAEDLLDIVAALAVIPNNDLSWDDWNRIGMATWGASNGAAFSAFDMWSQKSSKYDPQATAQRWQHYSTSPPDRIGAGTLFYLAAEAHPGWRKPSSTAHQNASAGAASGQPEAIFDPWDRYLVPSFPLDVLPPVLQRFVTCNSQILGCDPSALAMAALANCSAALDHRFALKMMRNGQWWASPRLWVLLVGDPSSKKTPTINVALRELEAHENRLRDAYEAELQAHLAAGGDPDDGPPKPPRFVVCDVTIEKLGEIISRYDRGIMVKRDEIAGWIGSMEKYGGVSKGASADRAFWLQSFDGGPYTVDRISRGEFRIRNLSLSLIGGIQPARLAEIRGLSSDGLLQRFIPVMMGEAEFPQDVPDDGPLDPYARLTRRLIAADHQHLIMTDDALAGMAEIGRHLHDLEQAAAGLGNGFQAFLGKLAGLAGSLTLVLHMAHHPGDGQVRQVERPIVERVGRLVIDFIVPHAFEFYRTAETVTEGDQLQKIASYVLTSGKQRLTTSDFTKNVALLRGMSMFDLNKRVSALVAGGWLTPVDSGAIRTWTVNPMVHQQLRDRAQEEERRKQALANLMNSSRRGRKGST